MDHEDRLIEIEKLLPEVSRAVAKEKAARALEEEAMARVLERVIAMLLPHFDQLADVVIARREEFSSEAQPSLSTFAREDYPEPGVLLFEYETEKGTGTPNRLHLGGSQIYLLRDGRLLLLWRNGFQEVTKRRGSRPDRQEVWATTSQEISPLEAVRHAIFIEAILETVKESLLTAIVLSEDAACESEKRTAQLMKLLDLIH